MISDKPEILSQFPLFSQLSRRDLEEVTKLARIKRLDRGEVLFRKGDKGSQVYALVSGRVNVVSRSTEGKVAIVRIIAPGEVFGEIALLTDMERTATVVAGERAEMLSLDRREFLPFLEQHPKVAIKLVRTLAEWLAMSTEDLEDQWFRSLPCRLAKKVLALANAYGKQISGGIKIDLKMSQQDLGNLVGGTRESVNKQLRAWQENGLIRVERGHIIVLDRAKLESAAVPSLT